MSNVKYIVIDESDAYHVCIRKYETEEAMLNGIESREISDIEVWEVKRRVRLVKRTAVVVDASPESA